MDTENAKKNKKKTPDTDFGCKPENFKGMFEMMAECFKTQGGLPDCSAMMKTMMQNCCGPKAESTRSEKLHKQQRPSQNH